MSAFITQLKVRFGDVDPAGIVYYPKIYDYIHEAFEELWDEHVGARYYHLLLERKVGFPLVHSEVDFRNPLRFGDRPLVHVTCTRLGDSSISLRYRFFVNDVACLTANMTVVCVELPGMKSTPIPEKYRTGFESIMEEA
ncbi:MAG: thioesterase family protein [Planctomycetota bacterium]